VAVLPAAAGLTGSSYTHPVELTAGFHRASLIAAGLCVLGGLLAAATIRNPKRAKGAAPAPSCPAHCGLDAPPAQVALSEAAAGQPDASG
jgi:hypothetical protein